MKISTELEVAIRPGGLPLCLDVGTVRSQAHPYLPHLEWPHAQGFVECNRVHRVHSMVHGIGR